MNELIDWQEGQLAILKERLDYWKQREERKTYYLLTKWEIDNIYNLSRKGLTGENLDRDETKAKSQIKLSMQMAIVDIAQVLNIGYPGKLSGGDVSLYSDNEWREIFSLDNVALIVRKLTERFGEDYALRITNEIRQGMKEYELRQGRDTNIDVPIIKRSGSDSWTSVNYGEIKRKRKVGRPRKP